MTENYQIDCKVYSRNATSNTTAPMIPKETPTMVVTTKTTTTSSTPESNSSYSNTDNINSTAVAVGTTIVVLFVLLATVVTLLLLVYYKRKKSALVNLIKPHKGSEENSYASSEHSHQQGSKYSESPEPGYDVIKPMHTKAKIFPQKLKLDMNPTNPSEYASIEDNNCTSSSHKTTGSHVCSCEYSAPSSEDNPSINYGEEKEEVCMVDIEKDNNKQKQLTEDAAKCNNNSTKDEISQISPQTIEMMYTEIQKQPKVNTGMDSEFEDSTPPPPPQTTEMMYTAVQKRPKDNILAEVEDDAPPVPPYMEKEDKETEATAKGSDEGSPPPVPPQTTDSYTGI